VVPAAFGEKVTASVCVPLAATVKLALEGAKGEEPEEAPLVARVTCAAALPVFVTLKLCAAACNRTIRPKLPKFAVGDVSRPRTAPRGSSVSVIAWGEVSTSVWMESVAVMGVSGDGFETDGARRVMICDWPILTAAPTASVEKPDAPVMVAFVTCASALPVFVRMMNCAGGAAPPQSAGPKSMSAVCCPVGGVGHPKI